MSDLTAFELDGAGAAIMLSLRENPALSEATGFRWLGLLGDWPKKD
jgi:hypothetical protein